jgi:hypothetical protein
MLPMICAQVHRAAQNTPACTVLFDAQRFMNEKHRTPHREPQPRQLPHRSQRSACIIQRLSVWRTHIAEQRHRRATQRHAPRALNANRQQRLRPPHTTTHAPSMPQLTSNVSQSTHGEDW